MGLQDRPRWTFVCVCSMLGDVATIANARSNINTYSQTPDTPRLTRIETKQHTLSAPLRST